MPRAVAEWIGATPDTPIPPRVKLRVFRAHNGICHITGMKIMPGDEWEMDHVIELADGGENKESNLAPALKKPHRRKSAENKTIRARMDAAAKRHVGITPAKGRPMPGTKASGLRKRMDGTVERR